MELDQKTVLLIQLSAAAATNALAGLRSAVTDAKALGVPNETLRQTIELALEVQQQPLAHTRHLTKQLLRETALPGHGRSCGCGCNHHHGRSTMPAGHEAKD